LDDVVWEAVLSRSLESAVVECDWQAVAVDYLGGSHLVSSGWDSCLSVEGVDGDCSVGCNRRLEEVVASYLGQRLVAAPVFLPKEGT